MKITVMSRPAEVLKTKWEGVERVRSAQWCLLEIDGLPTAFQVTCEPGEEKAPGEYELDAKSFAVSNGRLTVSRVVLRPVAVARTAVAKAS